MITTAGFQRTQCSPRELGSGIWKLWITQPCKLSNSEAHFRKILLQSSITLLWKTADLHLGLIPEVLTEMRVIWQTRNWSLQQAIPELCKPSGAKEIQEWCSLVTQACSSTKTLTNHKRLKKSTVSLAGSHWLSTSHIIPNTLALPVQSLTFPS